MKFDIASRRIMVTTATMMMMVIFVTMALQASAFSPTVVRSSAHQNRQTAKNRFLLKSSSSLPSSSLPLMDDAVSTLPSTIITPNVAALKDIRVTNVHGDRVRLGDVMMGDHSTKTTKTTSVLVFMRHLGCPYCWSYAQEIMQLQSRIETIAGANGPWLISIGDTEKLERFLEINPDIPKTRMFVDDYQFQAYETAGFVNNLNDPNPQQQQTVPPLTAPNLGGIIGWWNYFTNAIALAPIDKENPPAFGSMPEGVLRLGGTLVIHGDEIVYQWYDRIPGDHPDLEQVMQIVERIGKHPSETL